MVHNGGGVTSSLVARLSQNPGTMTECVNERQRPARSEKRRGILNSSRPPSMHVCLPSPSVRIRRSSPCTPLPFPIWPPLSLGENGSKKGEMEENSTAERGAEGGRKGREGEKERAQRRLSSERESLQKGRKEERRAMRMYRMWSGEERTAERKERTRTRE